MVFVLVSRFVLVEVHINFEIDTDKRVIKYLKLFRF